MPETGIEPVRPLFTKRRILNPMCLPISPLGQWLTTRWRRGPESNRTNRICNPGHNRFATAPSFDASIYLQHPGNKKGKRLASLSECGAGKESRTLDLNLGKVALYQLSYSRVSSRIIACFSEDFAARVMLLRILISQCFSVSWTPDPGTTTPTGATVGSSSVNAIGCDTKASSNT